MAEFKVIWSELAEKQFLQILEFWYLRTGNIKYSNTISRITKRIIKILSKFPKSNPISIFENLRWCAIKDFTIYYSITDNMI